VERVPWAAPAARQTHEFDRQVASLVQVADKSAAERMFHVSWRTVGRMVESVVNALLPQDRLARLRAITIDETSHKRDHRYQTVVSCVQTGRVVWIS
jgi:transposase